MVESCPNVIDSPLNWRVEPRRNRKHFSLLDRDLMNSGFEDAELERYGRPDLSVAVAVPMPDLVEFLVITERPFLAVVDAQQEGVGSTSTRRIRIVEAPPCIPRSGYG